MYDKILPPSFFYLKGVEKAPTLRQDYKYKTNCQAITVFPSKTFFVFNLRKNKPLIIKLFYVLGARKKICLPVLIPMLKQ